MTPKLSHGESEYWSPQNRRGCVSSGQGEAYLNHNKQKWRKVTSKSFVFKFYFSRKSWLKERKSKITMNLI